jgi:hypothetical protein
MNLVASRVDIDYAYVLVCHFMTRMQNIGLIIVWKSVSSMSRQESILVKGLGT